MGHYFTMICGISESNYKMWLPVSFQSALCIYHKFKLSNSCSIKGVLIHRWVLIDFSC